MSHFIFPENFVVPPRPWPYVRDDIADIARSAGLTETADIDNEIDGYAIAEWVMTLRQIRAANAALSILEPEWDEIIQEMRARHLQNWGVVK